MKVNFKLRKGLKKNTILLDFRFGRNIRVRYSTGLEIKAGSERFWDSKKCKIKLPNDVSNYRLINERLRFLENQIEKSIAKLDSEDRISNYSCNSVIKDILKPNYSEKVIPNNKSNMVLNYFDWYLDYYSKNNSRSINKPLTKGTLRTYRNSRNYLNNFLKTNKISKFYFEDIDEMFYNDFIKYGYAKNYSRNYIGTIIQKLKTITGHAYDAKVHNNTEFKKKYFAKISEDINHPYLNENELNSILNLELINKLQDNVRDIFLIASFTGLRVGDLTLFLKSPKLVDIKKKKFIHLKQEKTNNEVFIPINSKIKQILNKRNGNFPPAIHENVINKQIKAIARMAQINEAFEIIKTISGKKTSIIKPKYKFISSHTARRSFCTNAFNANMPPHQIMLFSGHKSEKVFHNYIKTSLKKKAVQASDHSFFD